MNQNVCQCDSCLAGTMNYHIRTREIHSKGSRWIKKRHQKFPFDILNVIAYHMSFVGKLKMASTCMNLHVEMNKYLEDCKGHLDYRWGHDFIQTNATNFITNFPHEKCELLTLVFKHSRGYHSQINLRGLSFIRRGEYSMYRFPSKEIFGFSVLVEGCVPSMSANISMDSERKWGRREIVNKFITNPIHSAHMSGWCFGNEIYTQIIVTGPLIFTFNPCPVSS